jgi:cell division septation protein DedD
MVDRQRRTLLRTMGSMSMLGALIGLAGCTAEIPSVRVEVGDPAEESERTQEPTATPAATETPAETARPSPSEVETGTADAATETGAPTSTPTATDTVGQKFVNQFGTHEVPIIFT